VQKDLLKIEKKICVNSSVALSQKDQELFELRE
jgi:hypothetical protein